MKRKMIIIGFLSLLVVGFSGCEKFLDAKPENTLAHPSSLKDLRALLDNESFVNNLFPPLVGIASDEFVVEYPGYYSLHEIYRDIYNWQDKGTYFGSWMSAYRVVSLANIVLESLPRIEDKNVLLKRQLEGEALFIRGWMYFNLAQAYCKPYSVLKQNEGLGLVLRTDSDSEIHVGRSSLKQTYDQLFSDLNRALELLPDESEYITRPSKSACMAALSRVYLTIEDYEKAERIGGDLLRNKKDLLNFETVNTTLRYPLVPASNKELLYYGKASSVTYINNASTYVDPDLYGLYEEHDLRKKVYFDVTNGKVKFKGFYHGGASDYSAVLAMDEIYLTQAECLARQGKISESLAYLNLLRKNRFEPIHFKSLEISDKEELLRVVLEERRRQLVCRGTRWLDLRRLNNDPRFAKTLERRVSNGQTEEVYVLKPNDLRYVHLIPIDAVNVGHYEQNPR